MSANSTSNPHYIKEHDLNDIKKVLEESLMLQNSVKWMTGSFPNGDVLNIPTMGQLTVRDYTEGAQITLEDVTSQSFTLTIDKYKQCGIQITDKLKKDSYLTDKMVSEFRVEIVGATARQLESDIAHLQASQTASNPNNIDGMDHRFVSEATNNVGGVTDFQLAMLALNKSHSMSPRATAYIDGLFLYRLQGISNLISQDVYGQNLLLKEGGITGAIVDAAQGGKTFVGRIAGFNTYVTSALDYALSETVTATASTPYTTGTVTAGVANMFVGEDTFIGAMRTMPEIKEWRENNIQSDIIHSTTRYGLKLYRPESLVVCLTDPA